MSNQTKLNKTFPLKQRGSKIPKLETSFSNEENFSSLSFSSACTNLKPLLPETATNYNIDVRLPTIKYCSNRVHVGIK